jgi:hypothetical protein
MDIRKRYYLLPFFVLLVGTLHGYLFLAGYRLSADDVAYHLYAMQGVHESWQFIKSAAIGQGRVVHFPDLITSLVGAYFADEYVFRAFYISLFFSNFVLAGLYFKKLSGINAVWFIALVLFSFHPLDYFHLSPTAYPFKISFPVFLILVSRIALLNLREGVHEGGHRHEKYWLALSFAATMFSEYAFCFALSLICVEFIGRVIARKTTLAGGWVRSAWHVTRGQYFLKDLFSIALFLATYIGFRLFFPSAYEGNQLPAEFHLHAFLKTLVGHIYGGTTFSSMSRHQASYPGYLKSLDVRGWLLISLMFTATFVSAVMALNLVIKEKASHLKAQVHYLIAAGMALLCALFVTAPVAVTTKYQSWCRDIHVDSCVFLDSSLSYLGFGIFLAAIVMAFAHSLLALRIPQKWVVLLASLVIALGASVSHFNNLRMEENMHKYVSGWERANEIACMPGNILRESSMPLANIVEPDRRISFHPGFDPNWYWFAYILNRKSRQECSNTSATPSDRPKVEVGKASSPPR